jgi:hypothetical protein
MTQKRIFDLPIGPGQYTEQSERGAQGRWYTMDKVRFRKGLAEKIGGWVQIDPQFVGTARRLLDWASLDAKNWSAIGTDKKLYLWQAGDLYDITPLRRTVTLAAPFETFTGETRVRVTDVASGVQVGDYVTFSNAIVGGASNITVDGEYTVNAVIDPDTYEITHNDTAVTGGSGEGGLSVLAEYQISVGGESVVSATGYGTGPYGAESYGTARTGSNFVIGIRTWSLDTWGEDLLACPRGGKIYWWDRSNGTGQRAVALGGDAPPTVQHMIVSQRDRHIIALGAYDYFNNADDPLLIRWSSTEDLNDWVPTSTNTSGDLRLYSGSKIVSGVRSRLETVIFTDVSVHTLPFVGGFDVFGLNIVGENVSILGPNAAVPIDHRVLFMAESDFYIYDGIVKVLNCDVRNFVYGKLNTVQRDKVYGGLNREFNEVWWFYPSFDSDAWVQQDLSLGLPSGYETATASPFSEVIIQVAWDEYRSSENGGYIIQRMLDESGYRSSINKDFGGTGDFSAIGFDEVYGGGFGFNRHYIASEAAGTTSWQLDAYDPRFNLGSDDWTFETWIKTAPQFDGNEVSIMNLWGLFGDSYAFNLRKDNGDKVYLRFRAIDDLTFWDVELTGWNNAFWHHLIVERAGDTIYVALGDDQGGAGATGSVEGSFSFTGALPNSTEKLAFFTGANQTFSTNPCKIDSTSLVKGAPRYGLHLSNTYIVPRSPPDPVDADPYWDEVVMLAKFEGTSGQRSYTEVSQTGAVASFEGLTSQLSLTRYQGATSVRLDWPIGEGDHIEFPDNASYDFGTQDWTIEGYCRFETEPNLDDTDGYCLFSSWGATAPDQKLAASIFRTTALGYQVRIEGVGWLNQQAISNDPATGRWFHWCIQRASGQIRFWWDGLFGGSVTAPADMGTNNSVIRIGAKDPTTGLFDGWFDNVRWTMGTARYPVGTYVPVQRFDMSEQAGGGGGGGVGYTYEFRSGGYTERVPTAANNYEHDYFLTNDEPILTPTQSEYAVELDVNPSVATGSAGLCFLRTNAVGQSGTDADDCYQWMVELNHSTDEIRVYKKEAAAPTAPDNLGGNTASFTTVTGSAMAFDQKYVIAVQFNTPQVTVWVDGIQAFQFDMSAPELALFTSGTAGLHCSDETVPNQYRFYNFAVGPVGSITAEDFDISPIEVNRYVAFNYEEGSWSTGKMARTAWADRSPLLEKPYAAAPDGYLYQHETGADDNGAAMSAYIESFDMEIPAAGEELMHVDQLIPDFVTLEGDVDVYLKGRKYPQATNQTTKGPYPIAYGTRKISTRIRARQIAIRVESNDTGDKWRFGTWRGRAGPHGKRG